MTNPMFSPQPNYSGVTIQISNPTVNTNPQIQPGGYSVGTGNYSTCPQVYCYPAQYCTEMNTSGFKENSALDTQRVQETGYASAYPAQYYLNNYNYQGNGDPNMGTIHSDSAGNNEQNSNKIDKIRNSSSVEDESTNFYKSKQSDFSNKQNISDNFENLKNGNSNLGQNAALKHYDDGKVPQKDSDMSKSASIIEDIDEREAKINENKKNTKETRIVALTDEYIKSLENYLNNPNDEIRLMASKEILTRLDEDKDRYNDAALNALLNKMLQDPSKLVRIAALSAFGSQLACGNDFTVQLLQNIQANPSADKEDVLQAADILLKMSAGTEIKQIPVPQKDK